MACNECLFDFCEITVCKGIGSLDFKMNAPMAGIYKLHLRYQEGIAKPIEWVLGIGENILFPYIRLNENYCYTGYIEKPDGNRLVFLNDSTLYDGFKFCTKFSI